MTPADKIVLLKKTIPANVKLIAVTKNQDVPVIKEVYDTGHRIFGENRVQELMAKYPLLAHDIEWHFIGHLQTNKVKYIAPFISLIHSVDSLKLLETINKEAEKCKRILDCLLEFRIAREETKYGLTREEAEKMLASPAFHTLNHVRICGVMGMASFTDDTYIIRKEFRELYAIFEELKKNFFSQNNDFKEISMGMTNDYKIAIEEGSTMVRIGTAIFG